MRRVDRLVVRELVGPFVFGVAIFTVLVMAGSFLFQFTKLLADGYPFLVVSRLAILLVPGILAKTLGMAMLLGTLLAFGRLSGDSEVVALRAAGYSVGRIIVPVLFFGACVSAVNFVFSDYVVPRASVQAAGMLKQLKKDSANRSRQDLSQSLYDGDLLVGHLYARDFNFSDRTLTGVTVTMFAKDGSPTTLFSVEQLKFEDIEKWRAVGKADLFILRDGISVHYPDGVWPDGVTRPTATPEDMLAGDATDLDAFSSAQIMAHAQRLANRPEVDPKQVKNLEYGYWNKFAMSLAGLVFGFVGAPLGIRNHRAGTATGFWLSVVIIFAYMLISNALAILSQGGSVPTWAAAFGPTSAGIVAGLWLVRRKNSQ